MEYLQHGSAMSIPSDPTLQEQILAAAHRFRLTLMKKVVEEKMQKDENPEKTMVRNLGTFWPTVSAVLLCTLLVMAIPYASECAVLALKCIAMALAGNFLMRNGWHLLMIYWAYVVKYAAQPWVWTWVVEKVQGLAGQAFTQKVSEKGKFPATYLVPPKKTQVPTKIDLEKIQEEIRVEQWAGGVNSDFDFRRAIGNLVAQNYMNEAGEQIF